MAKAKYDLVWFNDKHQLKVRRNGHFDTMEAAKAHKYASESFLRRNSNPIWVYKLRRYTDDPAQFSIACDPRKLKFEEEWVSACACHGTPVLCCDMLQVTAPYQVRCADCGRTMAAFTYAKVIKEWNDMMVPTQEDD